MRLAANGRPGIASCSLLKFSRPEPYPIVRIADSAHLDDFPRIAMTIRPPFSLTSLILAGTWSVLGAGCASSWWKPDQLYRLNRGPAAMNEESYYSIPPATLPSSAPADSSASAAHDPFEPFPSGRESALRPASGR